MTNRIYHRDTCRLCGSKNLKLVLPLKPSPLADEYIPKESLNKPQDEFPLDLYLCKSCGLAQLLDVVQAQSIYVDYIYESKSSLGLDKHFDNYAEQVLAYINPPKESLVVDIGSNDGILLRPFKKRNMRVLGVDPAVSIAQEATKQGLETLPEFFTVDLAEKIRSDYGPASIITSNNIFANVDNLIEIIHAVRSLLAEDGVYVIESFYLLDWMKNMVFDFMYHEHLTYFCVGPLQKFLNQHGLELIHVERVPSKGGSLRYTIQLKGAKRKVNSSVAELLEEEEVFGASKVETFNAYTKEIEVRKKALLCELKTIKAKGKKIIGYGASATSTTMIYHFELQPYLDFLVDEYEVKQGLYSPGCHIPVLKPEAIYDQEADYILVLAWRFAEPIIAKHQKFRKLGGKFLIPLPYLKIV